MRTTLSTAILLMLTLALTAPPAHAGGVVTVCDETHLLAALAGGGTVTFACSGTIVLTNTITIEAGTAIDGSGQEITISGNDWRRVFWVNPSATLDLNMLTIAEGNAGYYGGGAIYNDGGVIIVSNDTFAGNRADYGGAIYSMNGTVAVTDCTFSENRADFGGEGSGGGIYAICAAAPVNNLDQRGVTRPQGPHCDIGAVEQIIEPTAVRGSALSANSAPDAILPLLIWGMLLAAMAGIGIREWWLKTGC